MNLRHWRPVGILVITDLFKDIQDYSNVKMIDQSFQTDKWIPNIFVDLDTECTLLNKQVTGLTITSFMKANLKFLTLTLVRKIIDLAFCVASLQVSSENSDTCTPQKECYRRSNSFDTRTCMENILIFEELSRKPDINDINMLIQIMCGWKLRDENF